MFTRLCLFPCLILLLAIPCTAQTDWPDPIPVSLSTACDGNHFFLHILVDNYEIEEMTMDVRRVESMPDVAGELVLATGLVIPANQQGTEFVLADPGIGPEDVGYYEVTVRWPDGSVYNIETAYLSCTAEPFVMRGYLLTNDSFLPCVGMGLLECDTVILQYGDINQYVGTGELLDIYGWPQDFNGRTDCGVLVVRVEPLGIGTACEGPVPVTATTWSAVKAYYR